MAARLLCSAVSGAALSIRRRLDCILIILFYYTMAT